jgi:hypothetical protein
MAKLNLNHDELRELFKCAMIRITDLENKRVWGSLMQSSDASLDHSIELLGGVIVKLADMLEE